MCKGWRHAGFPLMSRWSIVISHHVIGEALT
jgi:hypothetical protein